MPDLTIEPAQPSDKEWSARLMASTDPWITLGRTYDLCLARVNRAGSSLFVARRDGQLAGFLLMDQYGVAGSPYVASVACTAETRGQGIGSAMLDFAESLYPQARFIFLCVSSFNTEARRLYERRGYTLVGELKDYSMDGASGALMWKELVRP